MRIGTGPKMRYGESYNHDNLSDDIRNIIITMPNDELVKMIYLMRQYTGRVSLVDLRRDVRKQMPGIFAYIAKFLKEQSLTEKDFLDLLEKNGIEITSGRISDDIRHIYRQTYANIVNILESYAYSSIVEDLSFFINVLSIERALGHVVFKAPILICMSGLEDLSKTYFVSALREISALVKAEFKSNTEGGHGRKTFRDFLAVNTTARLSYEELTGQNNLARTIIFDDDLFTKYLRMKHYDSSNAISEFKTSISNLKRINTIAFIEISDYSNMMADFEIYRLCDKSIKMDYVNEQDRLTLANHILEDVPFVSKDEKNLILSNIMDEGSKYKTRSDVVKEVENLIMDIMIRKMEG